VFAVVVGGITLVLNRQIGHILGAPELARYLWLLPLSLAGASIYSALNYWAVRKGAFVSIAHTRLSQSISQFLTQIGLGLATTGPLGLIIGDAVGRAAGSSTLASHALRNRQTFARISWAGLQEASKRYVQFPLLSSPSALLNAAGLNVPTLVLTTFYGAEIVGWFALAQRIVGIPATLIGQAVSQVYLSEAARLSREDPRSLYQLFLKTTGKLLLLGALPAVVLSIGSPWLFASIFGSPWRTTGQYMQLLAPMFLVQFAAVPVSTTAIVLERQDLQLAWDAGRFLVVVGSMVYVASRKLPAADTIIAYSGAMLLAYATLLGLLCMVLRKRIVTASIRESVAVPRPSVPLGLQSTGDEGLAD